MNIFWFYKRTAGEILQSLYLTDMTVEDIRISFWLNGEDGGPFFEQAEHLTDKFLIPIVDSDVDGAEITQKVIDYFLEKGDIEAKVNLSKSDTVPEILLV